MISIFSIPKPFRGDDALRQRNAIGSWLQVPDAEVLLCGDDEGVADTARELGCVHVSGIGANDFGTPYLNEAFTRAADQARHELLCYANCDIIFPTQFQEVITRLPRREFVAVGRRINFELNEAVDYAHAGWSRALVDRALREGVDGTDFAIDVLIIRKDGPLVEMPPFVVGRPGWDSWFLWNADQRGIPIVDFSSLTVVLHQNHDYAHVKNKRGRWWQGPEGDENRRLMGDAKGRAYNLKHATHVLTRRGVRPAMEPHRVRRRLARRLRNHPLLGPIVESVRGILGRQ